MRRLRLLGDAAALAIALDRLHVHTEVHGIVEREGEIEVAFDGVIPDLGPVAVEELRAGAATVTGLEEDRAIRVGEAILVRPPWVEPDPDFAGVELVVPRAMAFGSGEHGSTQAALCVMERMFGAEIESVADIGTGSGILALYALARGCERLMACDIDPDAVAAARELLPAAEVVVGGPESLTGPVDAVVANMRAAEIEGCFDEILGLWNRRGPLVLSGLRRAESAGFEQRLGRAADHRVEVGGFVALGYAPRDHACADEPS